MNLHPLTVHFPIAFLTLYSVMELLRIRPFTRLSFWFPIKAVLLIVGVIWTFISLKTGEQAAEIAGGGLEYRVVELHAGFAFAVTWVYAVLAVGYIITWIDRSNTKIRSFPGMALLVRVA
ncbi:hypothetical protein AUJ46_06050 [Candidatus Peregrinibacteria bacterium CG1_02_54_53]|nr:MAG: hypothetical protein AUJ46_06050 [Candidatus Peregrinibacteria bacterium CG1_02_54_53]